MPVRIGVDLVPLTRAQALLEPANRSVLARMLHRDEISECTRAGRLDPSSVAGRLAVKEAVFKLFRCRGGVLPWRSIHVEGQPGTWPVVYLDGAAAELARAAGICSEISISISHDGAYAVAVAATTTE
ncbi:MAG: 4'-phosphopantetheinyl transferase family protein [Pseudonocardiaceae bacterium]